MQLSFDKICLKKYKLLYIHVYSKYKPETKQEFIYFPQHVYKCYIQCTINNNTLYYPSLTSIDYHSEGNTERYTTLDLTLIERVVRLVSRTEYES